MITARTTLLLALSLAYANAADQREVEDRRQRAASAFSDGVLLVHARSAQIEETDGFRQDPAFYYLTGLENTPGAILAIDGRSREAWLFLPTRALYWKIVPPEGRLDSAAVQRAGIQHVVDWSELESFLDASSGTRCPLYYVGQNAMSELPENLTGQPALAAGDGYESQMPAWVAIIGKRWPSFVFKDARERMYALMDAPSESELVSLRAATKATVGSVIAGIQAVRPGASQRSAEWAMANVCGQSGARHSFWPWAMSGPNAVRPMFNASPGRYDHLDRVMNSGELVRIDDGCEVDHYGADLGRTVPALGALYAGAARDLEHAGGRLSNWREVHPRRRDP
ncbi:MAG: M24 family peptidase [Acidobacteriaceae bacterium]|nr:M24 family peptidase [Acidobacteriaceae bacterium]